MRYIFLGDSITDCNRSYDPENLGYGYVRFIHDYFYEKNNSVKVINKGFDGFTLSALKRLWKRDASVLKPDFLTILIGINDICLIQNSGIDITFALEEFKLSYRSFIETIRQTYKGPIILMEPFIFPYPEHYKLWYDHLSAMNQIIAGLAKQYNLFFIPLWDLLLNQTVQLGTHSLTTDGIHLTETGHKIIADQWLKIKKSIS